jgi:hypothetical protein
LPNTAPDRSSLAAHLVEDPAARDRELIVAAM